MMKSFFILCMFLSAALSTFAADTVSYRIRQLENWAFYGTQNPTVELVAKNSRGVQMPLDIKCEIWGANGVSMYELSQKSTIPQMDSIALSFAFKTMSPGFYNAIFWQGAKMVRSVNIAYEPGKILPYNTPLPDDFLPEFSRDYTKMANQVALERRDLNPQYTLTRNKKLSGKEKNVYDFKMFSRGGKVVKGLAAFPKGKKGIAAMITFVPVENMNVNPLADFTAPSDMAELVIYISQNGDGEEYFKNLLTEVVLSIDFFAQRGEIDSSKIFTQGEGTGAVYAFLASTLDDNVAASFVATPDFRRFVESFTIESLVKKVSVPVLFGLGLQDKTAKLQDDFAIYNMVSSVKEYFIFPGIGSVERNQWKYIRDMFILRMGL